MNENIFNECLDYWKTSTGNSPFWADLAKKHNYPSGESLRSAFKRERKKRGTFYKGDEKINVHPYNLPRVGVVDIETLFMIAGAWGLYDQNIGINQILQDSCMLSWAGKYLFDEQIYCDILTPAETIDRDTERIAKSAWKFINSCDIVIGHNYRNFDGKILNTEFLLNGLIPTRYRIIDTFEVAKNNFRFSSNKMAFINKKLGIREKVSNEGFPLWVRCSDGDEESLAEMLDYNVADILATEELFWMVQPYIHNAPNFSLYNKTSVEMACNCGCRNFIDDGFIYTNSAKYEKLRCSNCGSLFRGKKNILAKVRRDNALVKL